MNGIVVFDKDGNPVGTSSKAAVKGISQVVASRITMATPAMSKFLSDGTSDVGIHESKNNVWCLKCKRI